MTRHPDGGEAFPTPEYFDEKQIGAAPGMSLRDYFAARALSMLNYHNILSAVIAPGLSETDSIAQLQIQNAAVLSYRLADAMLEARK